MMKMSRRSSLVMAVFSLFLAAIAWTAQPAGAQTFACEQSGNQLTWVDVGADGDRYHVREFISNTSTKWRATVTGAMSYDTTPHLNQGGFDVWSVRYRINGVVNDVECVLVGLPQKGDPNPPADPICAQYGAALVWGTASVSFGPIVNEHYIIREVNAGGSSWAQTVDALPAFSVDGTDVGYHHAAVDPTKEHILRYWLAGDNGPVSFDVECEDLSPTADPLAPGGGLSDCVQIGRVVLWNPPTTPDFDVWHLRRVNADFSSTWFDTVTSAETLLAPNLHLAVVNNPDDAWRVRYRSTNLLGQTSVEDMSCPDIG